MKGCPPDFCNLEKTSVLTNILCSVLTINKSKRLQLHQVLNSDIFKDIGTENIRRSNMIKVKDFISNVRTMK